MTRAKRSRLPANADGAALRLCAYCSVAILFGAEPVRASAHDRPAPVRAAAADATTDPLGAICERISKIGQVEVTYELVSTEIDDDFLSSLTPSDAASIRSRLREMEIPHAWRAACDLKSNAVAVSGATGLLLIQQVDESHAAKLPAAPVAADLRREVGFLTRTETRALLLGESAPATVEIWTGDAHVHADAIGADVAMVRAYPRLSPEDERSTLARGMNPHVRQKAMASYADGVAYAVRVLARASDIEIVQDQGPPSNSITRVGSEQEGVWLAAETATGAVRRLAIRMGDGKVQLREWSGAINAGNGHGAAESEGAAKDTATWPQFEGIWLGVAPSGLDAVDADAIPSRCPDRMVAFTSVTTVSPIHRDNFEWFTVAHAGIDVHTQEPLVHPHRAEGQDGPFASTAVTGHAASVSKEGRLNPHSSAIPEAVPFGGDVGNASSSGWPIERWLLIGGIGLVVLAVGVRLFRGR